MSEPIKVVVRRFKEGDIILLFPNETFDSEGNILSYQYHGQHGAASPELINSLERVAEKHYLQLISHYEQHYNCKLEVIE